MVIKKDLAIDTDISIEEGLKIIISGGMLSPKNNKLII